MCSGESYYKVFQLTADIEAVKDQAVLSVNVVVETDCLTKAKAPRAQAHVRSRR